MAKDKKKITLKDLKINHETISKLQNSQMDKIVGGLDSPGTVKPCDSHTCVDTCMECRHEVCSN